MSAVKELLVAIKDVLLVADRLEEVGKNLSELAIEVKKMDKRLTRVEAIIEVGLSTTKRIAN